MSDIGINAVLQQIRALSNEINSHALDSTEGESKVGFSVLLKESIDKVNELQSESRHLSEAFERGDTSVSLAQVMVAGQKSSLAFQALSQVRNHLLTAYEEVMNMPV
jgi:flagellar hook-basal body complex protein FliE